MTQPASERDIFARTVMAGRTTAGIADALVSTPEPGVVRRRWGMVTSINADDTLDVNVAGIIIPAMQHDANYIPSVGERVYIDVVGTDMLVTGTTAPSGLNPQPPYVPPLNQMLQRLGAITGINSSSFTVTVRLDDNTAVTANYLSEYVPSLGDSVQVVQVGGSFVVLGAIGRRARSAVGTIEPTLLKSAAPNTILLQGQAISRTTYAGLWLWATTNDLVIPGYFGNGDGSTTFTLPDMRGRVPVGVGALGGETYNSGDVGGTARIQQTIAQMARHGHNDATLNVGTHIHDMFDTPTNGSHGVHPPYQIPVQAGAGANDVWAGPGVSTGAHFHPQGDTGGGGAHNHGIPLDGGTQGVTTAGPGNPMDVRSPYLALNWLIWV